MVTWSRLYFCIMVCIYLFHGVFLSMAVFFISPSWAFVILW